jgi:hypothetical protein
MVSMNKSRANPNVALLDSATTHTILRDPKYLTYFSHEADVWQECDMTIIAGRQNLKFREAKQL